MSKEKNKGIRFQTPKGIAIWPALQKPDTRFNEAGVYKTKLRLSAKDGKPLADTVTKLAKESLDPKKFPKADLPFEIDEETGEYVFRFKSYKRQPIFDTKGKPITSELNIGNGSVLKVDGTFVAYDKGAKSFGVTAYINAVQLVSLVEFGGANPFGVEEDGYEYEDDGSSAGGTFSEETAEEEGPTADEETPDF